MRASGLALAGTLYVLAALYLGLRTTEDAAQHQSDQRVRERPPVVTRFSVTQRSVPDAGSRATRVETSDSRPSRVAGHGLLLTYTDSQPRISQVIARTFSGHALKCDAVSERQWFIPIVSPQEASQVTLVCRILPNIELTISDINTDDVQLTLPALARIQLMTPPTPQDARWVCTIQPCDEAGRAIPCHVRNVALSAGMLTIRAEVHNDTQLGPGAVSYAYGFPHTHWLVQTKADGYRTTPESARFVAPALVVAEASRELVLRVAIDAAATGTVYVFPAKEVRPCEFARVAPGAPHPHAEFEYGIPGSRLKSGVEHVLVCVLDDGRIARKNIVLSPAGNTEVLFSVSEFLGPISFNLIDGVAVSEVYVQHLSGWSAATNVSVILELPNVDVYKTTGPLVIVNSLDTELCAIMITDVVGRVQIGRVGRGSRQCRAELMAGRMMRFAADAANGFRGDVVWELHAASRDTSGSLVRICAGRCDASRIGEVQIYRADSFTYRLLVMGKTENGDVYSRHETASPFHDR